MQVGRKVSKISDSITLKLNAKAQELSMQGKKIYNLTAGQLPFRPLNDFVDLIKSEASFLKSYQYSPVPGFPELREKVLEYIGEQRDINFKESEFDCLVSNGGKHSVFNILTSLIDEGDEIIILAPYWVSYPEMIELCGGVPVVVESSIFEAFVPQIEDIKKKINNKTKAIIINSPNNPSGIHYNEKWMKEFADLMMEYPKVNLISDEIYFSLFYYDPGPTYFYQYQKELLNRTVIVEGISKTLASTGLRIGFALGPKNFIKEVGKLQAQTTSGANSLIQRALMGFNFSKIDEYLEDVKQHLRENSFTVREHLRKANLGKCWYQSTSAFYFLIDFSQMPFFKNYQNNQKSQDHSGQICKDILHDLGVAMVPGGDFGIPNSARISLVLDKNLFDEAISKLVKFFVE